MVEFTDHRPQAARLLAQELLDVQMGSKEDAIALLEDIAFVQGQPVFTAQVKRWIEELAEEPS